MDIEKDRRTRIVDIIFEILSHRYYSPIIPKDLSETMYANVNMLSDCLMVITDVAEIYRLEEIEEHFDALENDESYATDFLKDCQHEITDCFLYWMLNATEALERHFFDWNVVVTDVSEFIDFHNCNYVENFIMESILKRSEEFLGMKLSKKAQQTILDNEYSFFFALGKFGYVTIMEIYRLLLAGTDEGIARFKNSATAKTVRNQINKWLVSL